MSTHVEQDCPLRSIPEQRKEQCRELLLQHLIYIEEKISEHCGNLGISRENIDEHYLAPSDALSCEIQIEKALKNKSNAILVLSRLG